VIIFTAVFLALIAYPLLFLECPALVGAIILSVKPALAKSLLPQQYFGLVSITIALLKSIALIGYMISYIVDYFQKVKEFEGLVYDQNGALKSLVPVVTTNANFFPSFVITNDSAKGVGVVLAVLITVVLILELLSISMFLRLFRYTNQIIKIVKEVNLEPRSSQIVPLVVHNQNHNQLENLNPSEPIIQLNNNMLVIPTLNQTTRPSSLNQLLDDNEVQNT